MGSHGCHPCHPFIVSLDIVKKICSNDRKKCGARDRCVYFLENPFVPLKANSIGSLTKKTLEKLGVDTTVWKAHSPRGAGVAMYKSLGFSSE